MFGKIATRTVLEELGFAFRDLKVRFEGLKAERDELWKRDEFFRAALVQTQQRYDYLLRCVGDHAQILNEHTATLAQHGKVVAYVIDEKPPRKVRAPLPDASRCTAQRKQGGRCALKAQMHGTCYRHTPESDLFDNGLAQA